MWPQSTVADVIHVDWSGGGDYTTIWEGIRAAAAGDTVVVASGTYTHQHCLRLETNIVLRSETGQPDCVTWDGGNSTKILACFNLGPGSLIEGITFSHGYEDNYWSHAGAVFCYECSLRIRHCVFRDNTAARDGGALVIEGSAVVEDCVFIGNTAGSTGGALCLWEATARNCIFLENEANDGAAAVSCDIWDGCSAEGCTFVGNVGPYVFGAFAGVRISNCTFLDNRVSETSGCVSVCYGPLTIDNSIIAGTEGGAALDCLYGTGATLRCCDIFGNAGGDWTGCVSDQLGSDGNIAADPLFCGTANPDLPWSLHDASPCTPENSPCGQLIGSCGVGCPSTAAEGVSWGSLKARYRDRASP